jgi:hypothetical protein
LRQGDVGAKSEHRKLYALVDIVYRFVSDHDTPKTGWTEYDYEYSGYTLDTVRVASDWSDEDKKVLAEWIQQETQKKIIETARRRLLDNQKHISVKKYSATEKLYSLFEERLRKLSMQCATAEQWLATINNLKKKGIREDEIQWSGVTRYLRQHTSDTVISKTELINNLNYKNIRLELSSEQIWGSNGGLNFKEVAFRMEHQVVYRSTLKLDEDCICILRYVDTVCNYRVGVVKTLNNNHNMALNKYWFALDSYGRAIVNEAKGDNPGLFFENSLDAKLAADKHAREHFNVRSGANPHTHFDHLTLYGGYDYREWIVSLPDFQRIFFGANFYDHNILAHIRTTTRGDKEGRRILFIEEVQSDWHQSGKRFGYDNSSWGRVANAPYKQDWPVLAAKLMLIHASENGYSGIAWSVGEVQEMRYMRHLQSIKDYYDKLIPKTLNKLVRRFNCKIETTKIKTRDPWLNIEKQHDKWRIADAQGKFKTKAKYSNRDEAMAVIARHCRIIDLEVPVLLINENLRQQISTRGLPSFGHTIE